MAKVLIINLGWEQQPLIERLSGDNELYGINEDSKEDARFKKILRCGLNNYIDMVRFGKEMGVEAVISDQCDYSLLAQYIVARNMNIPGPTWQGAYYSNNKYMQRQKCEERGILIPKYRLVVERSQVAAFANEVGYPIIIKPTDNRGSIGVTKIMQESEIGQAILLAQTCSKSAQVLAEEYIEGTQYTVDGYAFREKGCKTLAIAQKTMISGEKEVAMEINYPALLSEGSYRDLEVTNEAVNNNLGYRFGMTHSEYISRDGKYYLVESANRGGGCLTSAMIVQNVSGIDIMDNYINDCIEGQRSLMQESSVVETNSVTLKFFKFSSGRIKRIDGWEGIRNDKNYIYGKLSVSEGMQIDAITSDANRHGFVICRGDAKVARELTSRLTVENDR